MPETAFTPQDMLKDALTGALTARGIAFDTDGHGVHDWVFIELPDESQIWIADVNSELMEPLAKYSGVRAYLRSGEEWQVNIRVFESPNLGVRRDMAAWHRELAELLDAVETCVREVGADWRAAHLLAERIGTGWRADRDHSPGIEGRIVRHSDGAALRVYRHKSRGRRRISVVGHYPATDRPFRPGEDPIVTVAAGRTPSVLAREVVRSLLPRYRRVRFAVEAFNAERQRELTRRMKLAARISELLPEVTLSREDEGMQSMDGHIPGAGVDVTVHMVVDAAEMDLTFEDLPAQWGRALLGTLAGLRALQD